MKRFGLIGAAGYIAPRHLRAISGQNDLVVAMDVSDLLELWTATFQMQFFTEFEQFEAFAEDETSRQAWTISICSPNYLHVPHMKFALKNCINVICEKPLVLNASDFDAVMAYEKAYGAHVNSISTSTSSIYSCSG